jgi:hypothetical protein
VKGVTTENFFNCTQHLIAFSINDDVDVHMPAVDNDFLLLFYKLKVDHLKGLVGAEHPAQKMFGCVTEICERFEKLQHKHCSRIARKIITEEIIGNLQKIQGYIDEGKIPDTVGDESILWLEYDGEVYTLYDLSTSLIHQYVEYQSSIDLIYQAASPPRRHHTTASREGSPEQPSSSRGGPSRPSNGGHYGGGGAARSRSPGRRAPKVKLWSVQEIEAQNGELMGLERSIDVFQDYVKMVHTVKNPRELTDEDVKFFKYAITANQQIRMLQDDARHSGVYGRLSGENIGKQTMVSRDPLGETDKIRIYTTMQEALQSMAILISDGEVEDIEMYKYGGRTYIMAKVVHTLMHNAAEKIVELSTALFGTGKAPAVANASMQALLLRLQSISI